MGEQDEKAAPGGVGGRGASEGGRTGPGTPHTGPLTL